MTVERICPDIYHPAIARDGMLTRLRIPCGILNAMQCQAIGDILAAMEIATVQITNRANLQLRGLDRQFDPWCLTKLTACGLAAQHTAVDGIRNIMTSPTAGIDPREFVNVLPLTAAWDEYLCAHPELGILSNKFSVGFDGGGSVSIRDRPNDITLLAVSGDEFLVHLAIGDRGDAPVSVGVSVSVAESISLLGAIARSYLRGIKDLGGVAKKIRLRTVIAKWGLDRFLAVVAAEWGDRQLPETTQHQRDLQTGACRHLGVWQQQQAGTNYLGVAVRLGRMNLPQLSGLAAIAQTYGSGTLRLTPWQNIILPNIADRDLTVVSSLIADLGLGGHEWIDGLLTACAGSNGCQFAAGDTQADAIALADYLHSQDRLDAAQPLNIHLSGCDKSCAQHYQADIALWGSEQPAQTSGYRLCVGGGATKFGRELSAYLTPTDVRLAIDRLIRAYQERRLDPQESFRAFTDRQSLAQLQQVVHVI